MTQLRMARQTGRVQVNPFPRLLIWPPREMFLVVPVGTALVGYGCQISPVAQ